MLYLLSIHQARGDSHKMTEVAMRERQQKQVDENYKVFLQRLQEDDEFYQRNYGKYALMRDCKIVDLFDSWQDARKTAMLLYKADKLFSIQKVDDAPIDLGFYSHALL